MIPPTVSRFSCLLLAGLIGPASAELAAGDRIGVTLRGVPATEQEKVNGKYQVGESGAVRLPLLDELVPARGLSPEQFARAAEAAYKQDGIYDRPAIEVEVLAGGDQDGEALISVGGQIRRAGQTPYRKQMTVIQAIDAAGGRNDFGGRNILLLRAGKQYCLDFSNLKHKNIELLPGDSLQVEQKGIIDRWKGDEMKIRDLLKRE